MRDPRIDPKAGDVVVGQLGEKNTVNYVDKCRWVSGGAWVGVTRHRPWGGSIRKWVKTITHWRRWAKEGEVLHAAD